MQAEKGVLNDFRTRFTIMAKYGSLFQAVHPDILKQKIQDILTKKEEKGQ